MGQHPLVVQILNGVLNKHPPKPWYTHTWDVCLVTKYFGCLGRTKPMPLKPLSIKLAMFFALSCPFLFFPLQSWTPALPWPQEFPPHCVYKKARLSKSTTLSLSCVSSIQWETLSCWHFEPLSQSYTKLTSSLPVVQTRPTVRFLCQTTQSNHCAHS